MPTEISAPTSQLIAQTTPPTAAPETAAASLPLFAAANEPTLPKEPSAPDATSTASAANNAPATPSQNVTINLINRLVQRGVLPKEDAADLIKQAEADTAEARAQAAAQQQAAIQSAVAQALASAQISQQLASAASEPPPSDDDVRVTYIPENVRAQMRDEIKQDVLAQARSENWAAPNTLPDWVSRFRLMGDIRVRGEGDFFPSGNDNTGAFPNFNAINTGAPFDVSGTQFSPQQNVDQDRERLRLRVRFGVEADLGEGFTAGLRIATGQDDSPTSTNQSLGYANNGQGGDFSKYAIWLDRGFLKYEAGGLPGRDFTLSLGRFENPFYRTSEITWDEDLGFDGVAASARYEVVKGVTPFLVGGAFPVFNTDFNFSSNQPAKFRSEDKWLYGGQLGADWRISKDFDFKGAGAYYYFDNVEGRLSSPFIPQSASDQGNTDDSRPSFAQKGNTYMALRQIISSPLNNFGTTDQFQYFGLATPFHVLNFAGQLDFNHWEPFRISLTGEWMKNLAFDRSDIEAKAVNNRGPNGSSGALGAFDGGDTGWIVGLQAGSAALEKRWDWQLGVNYRRVESDATVDGFVDSDFGLGGTNLKGYTLWGNLALSSRVWLGLRWMSADQVAGPPFSVDILQVDVGGKF